MAKKKKGKKRRRWMKKTFSHYQPVIGDEVQPCTACAAQPKLSWQVFKNGKMHCRVQCPRCGEFLGFAPERIGLFYLEGIPLSPDEPVRTSGPVDGSSYVPYSGPATDIPWEE